MKTSQHASAERATKESVMLSHSKIVDKPILTKVLESLPYVAAVLNEERQYVFVNKTLLELLSLDQQEAILGLRLGESISCVHADNDTGGCGTSADCKYCGAVNSILESQTLSEKVSKECRITTEANNGNNSFDFSVTCNPIKIRDLTYTLVVIKDISDEKRRRVLERIFFHDVLNKAGSMDGLIDILQETDDPVEIKNMLAIIQTVTGDLVSEIQSQRDLLSVESGDFEIEYQTIDPRVIVAEAVEQMRHHNVTEGKKIECIIATSCEKLETDPVLLNRVLTNMLKNAIEASSVGETITAMAYDLNNEIGFCIQNPLVMSDEIKSQVFKRSFSTKGSNRGLGTYSIKLLGENYLKGKVYFSSNQNDGTQFFIEVPLKAPGKE